MKKFLERYGWLEVERHQQGCRIIVLWLNLKSNLVFRQFDAVRVQRNINEKKRMVTLRVKRVPVLIDETSYNHFKNFAQKTSVPVAKLVRDAMRAYTPTLKRRLEDMYPGFKFED